MSVHESNRRLIGRFNAAMYDFDPVTVRALIEELFSPNATIHMTHPFETLSSVSALWENIYAPLSIAIPDLEKRVYITMAGFDNGVNWVGCAGYYTGGFMESWLDIPPTGHQVSMRFHEFYRIDDGRITEVQTLWDIPELMMQAGVWPLAPSLGREWNPPGPATCDGNIIVAYNSELATTSRTLVSDMLTGLSRFAQGGLAAMALERYWHPRCSWYGPSGIGTCRGISGFRNWHQIPFLKAMPNRRSIEGNGYLFADQNYVAFTGWPGMAMSLTADGWLGIPPINKEITLRSLDFWRCENGKIRENWVLVDVLHAYAQLGVDVFARMRELNKARYRQFED
ncbi:ester cyclase [Photobacterium sp. ZSDE20]|uniref:Ester cyclase n=1 Tax=Photobacterium pectinilyticum TaxID=2906793 RepID=A0ABT1N6F5_9GAMM|nr:ester cyclase [Photobacterium sp. ZSDE20]MCQ1060301.1 ester cyclase [Photobacterium sp. ZSDE20]MDD1827599.1 ester cyclase [Photobacterium sp. ZSDE20]